MLDNKKIVVVMPAYNAVKTLIKTYNELPIGIVRNYSMTHYFPNLIRKCRIVLSGRMNLSRR